MALRKPQQAVKPGGSTSKVRVVCRCRPTNSIEISKGGVQCVKHTHTNIEVMVDDNPNVFQFDSIFGADSTQVEVFQDTAGPLIGDVLAGYNATIFAYGQTGTGKTHTMEGNINSDVDKGIIPRTVEALFDGVSEADENIEFTFKVSYVEIYLEKIRDLLDENRVKVNLTVREDKIKGVYIAGVTEEYVSSVDELLHIMALGATNRATAATGMNEGSSRSHSVFTITVTQKDVITNATKSGKLVLVDLAGSEMVRKTNASGQQLEEAKTINKSLSALGQVIYALTDEKSSHVPYRDSKLTRVLQDSLGGNSKTVLIVAISPSSFNANETVGTLRFGTRAKSIENKVTINQTRSVEELESLLVRAEKAIDAQTSHIISLSTQLQALQSQEGGGRYRDGDEDEDELEASGRVVLDAAKVEAEAALLMKLQEQLLQLTQELDEERQESTRKDLEIKQMGQLLKDKERLIHDAANMLSEVQRSNDSVRERCEQLLREKIDAVGELESLRSQMEEEVAKSKFNFMEMEVTLSTLETENKQLKIEIAEMSGDATAAPTSSRNNVPGKSKNVISSASTLQQAGGGEEENEKSMIRKMQNSRDTGRQSVGGASAIADTTNIDPARVMGLNERKELLDQFSAQFASTCLKYQIDEQASAELFAIMDGFSVEQEANFVSLEDKFFAAEKTHSRRARDLEDQRSRLEKDLQGRIENMIQLQIKYDSLSRMDNRQLADTMAEKDRAYRKSLQQRLEQLVAVHRQLLRKFASLELETTELKKKTQLRDERIRQLEGNSKGLIGNIRQQAERHVAELTNLREQIQIMKSDHDQRIENYKLAEGGSGFSPRNPHNSNRVQQPKVLRGGGGASRSFYSMETSAAGGRSSQESDAALDSFDVPPPALTLPTASGSSAVSAPPAAAGYGGPPPPYQSATSSSSTTARPSVFSRFMSQK